MRREGEKIGFKNKTLAKRHEEKEKKNMAHVRRDQLRCSTQYDKNTRAKQAVAEVTSIKQTAVSKPNFATKYSLEWKALDEIYQI